MFKPPTQRHVHLRGLGPWAWSKGRQLSGALLHLSREPGVRRPCSDFMDMLQCLIKCPIIIIIITHRMMWRATDTKIPVAILKGSPGDQANQQ